MNVWRYRMLSMTPAPPGCEMVGPNGDGVEERAPVVGFALAEERLYDKQRLRWVNHDEEVWETAHDGDWLLPAGYVLDRDLFPVILYGGEVIVCTPGELPPGWMIWPPDAAS